jgi:glycosyltransferase involved in cell wall biosynthesis
MRIAYLTQSYPPMISGAAIIVERLALHMTGRRHPTLVMAASNIRQTYIIEKDLLRIVRLASLPNPKRAHQRFALSSLPRIGGELKSFKPDLIHVHDVLLMGLVGLQLGRTMRIPVVATLHQLPWFICAYLPKSSRLKRWVDASLWSYGRWLNQHFQCLIVPTHTIASTIESIGGFKTVVISNGVDLERFSPAPAHPQEGQSLRARLGLMQGIPILLHVGRLDIEKHVELVIRAAARVLKQLDAQLLVVGDGKCRQDLIALANDLGVGNRSFFPGFLDPNTEIPAIYRLASVFITASEIETQGLVLLEALASGLPVVAVEATCIPEIIKNESNGFLVSPGDINAMSEKIFEVVSNPSKASQMGKIGRSIIGNHAVEASIDQYEDLYQSLLLTSSIKRPHPILIDVNPQSSHKCNQIGLNNRKTFLRIGKK